MTRWALRGAPAAECGLAVGGDARYVELAPLDMCQAVETVGKLRVIAHGQAYGAVITRLDGRAFFDGEDFVATSSAVINSGRIFMGKAPNSNGWFDVFAEKTANGWDAVAAYYDQSARKIDEYPAFSAPTLAQLVAEIEAEPVADFRPSQFLAAAVEAAQ